MSDLLASGVVEVSLERRVDRHQQIDEARDYLEQQLALFSPKHPSGIFDFEIPLSVVEILMGGQHQRCSFFYLNICYSVTGIFSVTRGGKDYLFVRAYKIGGR